MQKDFSLKINNEIIRGFVHIPHGITQSTKLLIISHGLTGNKYGSHNLWVALSRYLVDKGIASIRFDFRGNGDSDGLHQDITVSKEVVDLKAIYEFARNYSDNIILAGYSLGAIVTSIVAGQTETKKVLLMAAVAPEVFVQFAPQMIPLAKDFPADTFEFMDGFLIGKPFMAEMEQLPFGGSLGTFIQRGGRLQIIRGSNDPFASENIARKYEKAYGATVHTIDGIEHNIDTQAASEQLFRLIEEYIEDE